MSIQGMRRRFAVHLRYVLYVIIGVFIVGLPFVFTPGLTRRTEEESPKEDQEAVALLNGQPLSRSRVDQRFDQGLSQLLPIYASVGQSLGLDNVWRLRLQAFDQAVQDELLARQAAAEGISVSRREVSDQARRIADQQLEPLKAQYKGDQLRQVLGQIAARMDRRPQAQPMSEGAFRKWMIERLLAADSRDQLREEMIVSKLRQKVTGGVTPTEQDLLVSYDRLTVRQVIVSLKPDGEPARTNEEARKRAEELLAKAKSGADFAELARTESDEPQAKTTGGAQRPMLITAMPPDWQKAVAPLQPGEISPPIKLPLGYYLVKMDSRTRQLPQDFEKNKQRYLTSLVQRRQDQAWQEYANKLRGQAKIQVTDPELLAYQAMEQRNDQQALEQLRKAAAGGAHMKGLEAGAVYYNLAALLAARNQWKEAADSYTRAVDAVSQEERDSLPDARAQALMGLARAEEQLGKPDDALQWYQEASNWSDTPPIHQQLILTYQRLGKPELVKKEQEWLAQYQQAQAEKEKALAEQRAAAQQKAAPPGAVLPGAPKTPARAPGGPPVVPQTPAPARSAPGGPPAPARPR